MADKAISELTAATLIGPTDLFVMEQGGTAKKATGQLFENWLLSFADGHGGIQSLVKTSSTGTDPVIDTYTITYADTTTSTFTVTNGLKGDKGDQTYFWIKYAAQYPTADSDMSSSPDDWIGVYSGTSSTAPTHYTDYTWFEWKGATGDPGDPSEVTSHSVTYLEGTSGNVVPEGSWTTTVPSVTPGNFLWTRTQLTFNDDTSLTAYSVSRFGIDGTGSVSSVNTISPDTNGNVSLSAANIPMTDDNTSVQVRVVNAETDIDALAEDFDRAVLQAAVRTISGNGTTSGIALTGLTADHVVANWGMFSDAACTTPIPENSPTCDITITTAANAWSVTIANFSATFYLRPTFILKQN